HLDMSGARYPARAYRGAARTIRRLPASVGTLAMSGRATDLRGIGQSIQRRVIELCETGSIAELERMRERTPSTLMVLPRFRGVSRAKAERIFEQLELRTLDDLLEAVDDGRLLTVPGIGPATVEAIRDGLLTLETEPEELAEGMLRSHAQRAADDVRVVLAAGVPGVLRVHVGGQLARGFEVVDVLDLVVVAEDAPAATAVVRELLDDRGWYTSSEAPLIDDECLTFALQGSSGAGVRIHVADVAHEAEALLHGIGPRDFARAALAAPEPLPWVPPELRDRPGILERARAGTLPQLVEVADLRGEMHCHSEWSDGRATVAEMAAGAIARGYGHVVITDHSHSLFITNGLNEAGLAAQWRELQAVRAELPSDFSLLQGTEMEILPDGSLDFTDDVMRRLDWVVASIHTRQRQSAEEINRRIERALRNPYVDCIGHPTSRLLLRRPKTALDTDRLIELAAETGTFLEINASPDRLDLDAETAERAAAAGVLLVIDSDAHGPNTLGLVEHGVAIARRAGLTAEQVLNTRSWAQIRELQKRWRA
ncbi:MAG: hypothetical protein JWN72_420, partial [Thermoleophilia bacterium]|nr:hypothetical protein [Thermoleophilia bacterium]